MNINQIKVLNRALDGEDIYGLPSLKEKPISSVQIELIKSDLLAMGILNSHDTLTNEGAMLTRKIKQYKESNKYIHLNHMIIAPIDEGKAIVMKGSIEDIIFVTVDTTKIVDQLSGIYKFLSIDSKVKEIGIGSEISRTSLKEIFIKYKIKTDNSFILKTHNQTKALTTNEVYFAFDENLYVFRSDDNELSTISSKNINNLLKERLSV
jgi:hypothetical protein